MLSHIITNFIAYAVFNGASIVTLCLVISSLFKLKLYKINKPILVSAINITMLIISTVFMIGLLMEIFSAYFSAGENIQYMFIDRWFGPYWWAAWLLLIRSTLLPQIFWFRKLRQSFIATIVIVLVWAIISIPVMWSELAMDINWLKQLEQLFFYGLFITTVYLISNRKTAKLPKV